MVGWEVTWGELLWLVAMSCDAMRRHVMCPHVMSCHLLCPAMGWNVMSLRYAISCEVT